MNEENFIKELSNLGIELTNTQLNQLSKYCNLLMEINKTTNLTAITDKDNIYLKHFLDSILACQIANFNEEVNVCDIGTGAGFPGIVLKIIFPNLNISLVDATKKKTDFLELVIKELGLTKIKIYNQRIEDFAYQHIEEFDVVISRAVAKLNVLLELSCLTIKINGSFVAMKSIVDEELQTASNAINKLNMKLNNVIKYKLPIENSDRSLIRIMKIKYTPDGYPRNFSKISKFPL